MHALPKGSCRQGRPGWTPRSWRRGEKPTEKLYRNTGKTNKLRRNDMLGNSGCPTTIKKKKKNLRDCEKREKAVQAEMAFKEKQCPYPTPEAHKKAVHRVKSKLRAHGVKLAHLVKGIIKHANNRTKAALKELNVSYASPQKFAQTPTETLRQSEKKKRQRIYCAEEKYGSSLRRKWCRCDRHWVGEAMCSEI